jgi:hypothetical protein
LAQQPYSLVVLYFCWDESLFCFSNLVLSFYVHNFGWAADFESCFGLCLFAYGCGCGCVGKFSCWLWLVVGGRELLSGLTISMLSGITAWKWLRLQVLLH